MRLIDADELLTDPYFQDESIPERDMFIEAVEDTPTIDAVEVVRCGECRFGLPTYLNPEAFKHCALFCKTVNADFFCAGGERKMDAEVEG